MTFSRQGKKVTENSRVRKLPARKDPVGQVTSFLRGRGIDGAKYLQQKTTELATWSVPLSDDEELEISLEGLRATVETTLYIGVNLMPVPLKQTQEFLTAVLSVSDTLIGAKLSLVNYDVVLSATEYLDPNKSEQIDYLFELITRQKDTVYNAILEESGDD